MTPERLQGSTRDRPPVGTRWAGGGSTVMVIEPEHDAYDMVATIVVSGKRRGERVYVHVGSFGLRLRESA